MDSKKFLFVSLEGLITDIAWQVIKEGHEAKYFIEEKSEQEVGDGFVPKTDNWEKEVEWADVIVFDDVLGQGAKAQKLREQGKLVVGGTAYSDKLEDDRSFGQEELKRHGVSIIPFQDFTSFDEAIAFVQGNPGRYVIKPSGEAQNVKQFLFVGEEEDGKDVLQMLEAYKKAWSKKIKVFQLQKRVSGVEVAVGAFFNGSDFMYPINVNFEHKKLFPGNIGPSTGEMGCYDEKTEVLTDNGWKVFKNVKKEDNICTLNPKTHEIEYHKPTKQVIYTHHKQMVEIKNQTLDMLVTLDHNMYVCPQTPARKGKDEYTFIKAKDLEYQCKIKRTGTWNGKEEKEFLLPEVAWAQGGNGGKRKKEGRKIPMSLWLEFLGIWIAEGSVTKTKISIAQKAGKKAKVIEKMLARLPYDWKRVASEFYTYDKQLAEYLKEFGKAGEKSVPEYVKNASEEDIKLFLKWFCLGDGTMMKNGYRIFYTVSKQLADDIQELLLKIGRVGVVKERKGRGKTWIVDHYTEGKRTQYEIHERVKKGDSWIDKRDTKIVPYAGKVYCLTVQNHIMYVRRNGKPCWCGNTTMFWSGPNRIFNQTLKKLEETLRRERYVGYIDINCIVNAQGIYPLEFTARFGYPTISIQQEGIQTPMGEFLYGMAEGSMKTFKTKNGFQIGVRLVVPPFPFKDTKTFEVNSKEAVIIFKKLNGNGKGKEGVHIEDVKLVEGEWLITGNSGVILIIVGTGQSMRQAQRQVYARISNILMPNMYYRKDIGDRWYEDSDRLHTWGYLREN